MCVSLSLLMVLDLTNRTPLEISLMALMCCSVLLQHLCISVSIPSQHTISSMEWPFAGGPTVARSYVLSGHRVLTIYSLFTRISTCSVFWLCLVAYHRYDQIAPLGKPGLVINLKK